MSYVALIGGRASRPALRLLLTIAVLFQPAAAQGIATLEVLDVSGRVLLALPVEPGGDWCLAWNHSVTGIRVLDCYRHRNGRMVLMRSHQPDFAAGLGHTPGRGRMESDGAGGYWIENINEPVPDNQYVLRVGGMGVNHRVVRNGRVFSLSADAAGERVTVRLTTDRGVP